MAGRVTSGMMHNQFLYNINKNLNVAQNLQNQLSTGRKINKPSDDPVGLSFAMRYRSEISMNDQHKRNIDDALSWLDYSDTLMDQVNQVVQRVNEQAVLAANGTNPDTALDAIKTEMEQLYEQLVNIGNSQFRGKYVFNGELTDVQPYPNLIPHDKHVGEAAQIGTDKNSINFEIGVGVTLSVNITGEQVFGTKGESDNLFQVMTDFIGALEKGDQNAINDVIGKLDSRMNKFLNVRADIGAKTNRVELAQDRLEDINLNLTEMKSKTEDALMAEVITQFKINENIYMSSLSVGAKIITPSLVDFLR